MKNTVPVENGIVYNEFSNTVQSPRHTTLLGRFNSHSRHEKLWMCVGVFLLIVVIIKLIVSGIYFQMRINQHEDFIDSVKPKLD